MQLELLKDPRGLTKAKRGAANFQDALSYAEKANSNFLFRDQGSKISLKSCAQTSINVKIKRKDGVITKRVTADLPTSSQNQGYLGLFLQINPFI